MDYIKSSQTITEFLKKQGITIEVDAYAPCVCNPMEDDIRVKAPWYWTDNVICPYFGPGGADNSLKALRAWIAEQPNSDEWCLEVYDGPHLACGAVKWVMYDDIHAPEIAGFGKTDGIALADLLYKIATEKNK